MIDLRRWKVVVAFVVLTLQVHTVLSCADFCADGENPCQNGGICIDDIEEEACCNCEGTGYEGNECQADIDECASVNDCNANADCTNTDGSFTCECNNGFEGDGITCSVTQEQGVTDPTTPADGDTTTTGGVKNMRGHIVCIVFIAISVLYMAVKPIA